MLKVWTIGLVICVLPLFATACTWWNYDDCPSWPPCSASCGGGRQCRTCESCFWRIDKDFCQSCNELCYNGGIFQNGRCQCPAWRGGACCQECTPTSINHCLAGKEECGGDPDGLRCHQCETGYQLLGNGSGCQECNTIPVQHCLPDYKECNGSAEGIRCIRCEEGYMPSGYGNGCQECAGIAVKHCLPGSKKCNGSAEGIRCNMCEQGYMPGGYGNGCQECAGIAVKFCLQGRTECNGSSEGIQCIECEQGYKPGGYGNGCKLDETSRVLPEYALPLIIVFVVVLVVFVSVIVWCICKSCK